MKNEQEIAAFLQDPGTEMVRFAVTDIDGVLRGKMISTDKFKKILDSGAGFCNVVFGWDVEDNCYTNGEISGWHTGYPDAMARIDPQSFRQIPWDNGRPFLLADFEGAGPVAAACPRSLLKRIRQQAIDMGFSPIFSKEYEWFNFFETDQSLQEKQFTKLQPISQGMFGYALTKPSQNQSYYNDISSLLPAFDIPLEGLHTETGPGVYEAAIAHTDILEAADRATLFKTAIREIAIPYGITPSFMAKHNANLPGCSGHVHQSLWADGRNLFYQEDQPFQISELLQQYIAGQLYCLPYIMPIYAPTVNSYKRYVPGSWAATTVSWGIENRTTALRIINHSHDNMNLETRAPGADTNPYLTMAAALASGLYGIANKLSLDIPGTTGNEYAKDTNRPLPQSLGEGISAMRSSSVASTLFGAEFTEHFLRTREWEWEQYKKAVTDWELKRYFEII